MTLFDQISMNVQTGSIAYPKLDGFELNMERVYSTASLFMPHCGGNLEMAVRQAIHQQLAAHQGLAATLAGLRPAAAVPAPTFVSTARKLVRRERPAATGARFRHTKSGAEYWVSAPKRGAAQAWRKAGEAWAPCELTDVAADRWTTVEDIVADAKARSY